MKKINLLSALFFAALVLPNHILGQKPIKLSHDKNSREVIPLFSGDQEFIAVKDLVELLNAGFYENLQKKKAVMSADSHQIKITGFNAFVVVDERFTFQMPVEAEYVDKALFVPIQFFLPILNEYLKSPILVNSLKPSNIVVAKKESKAPERKISLTDIVFEKKSNGLLIKVKTDGDFDSEDVEIWRNKSWVYLTVSGGSFDKTLVQGMRNGERFKLLKENVIFQHTNSAQFSFNLTGELSGQDVTVDDKNHQIVISLRVKDFSLLESEGTIQVKNQWLFDKIVLDAGHGGKDFGATGKNGTREKDVTLGIVLKLGKLIRERLGIPIEYTRDKDSFPTLNGRTHFANQRNAKLFISIHCNANKNRKASGFEVFFLSPSRTSEALAVARKENEVIDLEEDKHKYGDFTDEKFILANIMQSVFVKESEDLAAAISNGIDKQLEIENRGVSQAPFYVLMGASMPSILIETAFISNPTEEAFLKSEAGQNKLAEGVLEGIQIFIKTAK